MSVTYGIKVYLKNSIVDSEGIQINHSLNDLGWNIIDKVKSGKYYEISFSADVDINYIKKLCESVLVNQVIEEYEIEKL
tara:strand:+ start:161 stop:397 length:237 start_codon:yes stop_codon:yes gene_type:complete